MLFLWYVHRIPVGFLLALHEAFMGSLWDLYDIPGRFVWDSCRNSMIFHDISMYYRISMAFLWG